jgi:hypothetical protein
MSDELDEGPLEVHWIRMRATERIDFRHQFEPEKRATCPIDVVFGRAVIFWRSRPPLRPKRSAYGLAGLRGGRGPPKNK